VEVTTETLPEVNKELFAKIRDQIEAEPDRFNQDIWETYYGEEYNECGTARCTAGWAIFLTHPGQPIYETRIELYSSLGYSGAGQLLLGLTDEEMEYLFYTDNEPAQEMLEHYAVHGREGWELPADE
jgi:hypothetical protein